MGGWGSKWKEEAAVHIYIHVGDMYIHVGEG